MTGPVHFAPTAWQLVNALKPKDPTMDTATAPITIRTHDVCITANDTRTGGILAYQWGCGLNGKWTVKGRWTPPTDHPTETDAHQALVAAAHATLAQLPPCGMTHDDHLETWTSWRDDCTDPQIGCGFAMQDIDQCQQGHPDDGTTFCGACGHWVDGGTS